MNIACGKCSDCLKRRASGWGFRLEKESRLHQTAFFVTLTYDTDYVPITNNGFMTLEKDAVSKWIRRIRESHRYRKINPETGRTKYYYDKVPLIRYYAVGEYGTQKMRPHYHAIIFGVPLSDLIGKRLAGIVMQNPTFWLDGKQHFNTDLWPYGTITLGTVSGASIGYTLKYIQKPGKIPLFKKDDRLPEFAVMSKKLGANYLSKAVLQWHHADIYNRYYLPTLGGHKIAMPRYYKDKLFIDKSPEYKANAMMHIQNYVKNNDKSHLYTQQNIIDLTQQKNKSFFDVVKARPNTSAEL